MFITKKQFEKTYRKYPPTKCELFYIKHISASSLSRNLWPALFTCLGLFIPFLITLMAKILNFHESLGIICSIIYGLVLAGIGIYYFLIWNKRRKRIENICKDLNITMKQYEEVVNLYYYENYFPDIKDYILNILK